MKIKTFLLFAGIILLLIIFSGKTILYYYWTALVITVGYLNSHSTYLQKRYKLFNTLFLLYLLFVVWERTRHYEFFPWIELQINNSEHILFGLMICFIASLVLLLPPFTVRSFFVRLLLSVLLFNGIGFINEWFQNRMYSRPVFILIPDSVKDLRMNGWGTLVFVVLMMVGRWFYNNMQTRIAI